MKILCLCRGSSKEGLGHLLRTRTFIKTAARRHEVELIAIIPAELAGLFEDFHGTKHFVETDPEVLPLLGNRHYDVLCVDMVWMDAECFEAAKSKARLTASLSPIFDLMPELDLLFTRTRNIGEIPGVKIYGGFEYAIFGEHCTVIGDTPYRHNLALPELPIAICMGGADAANKTLHVIRALVQTPMRSTIWVLLGEGYVHSYNALVGCVRGNPHHEVILAKTNRSMWSIMSNCAIAIVAGGLTTIEAIYAGLPTINLFEKSEHIDVMAKELFDMGVCVNGGLFGERSLQTMVDSLLDFAEHRDKLWNMHQSCHGRLDMRGSERVLAQIEKACGYHQHSFASHSWINLN